MAAERPLPRPSLGPLAAAAFAGWMAVLVGESLSWRAWLAGGGDAWLVPGLLAAAALGVCALCGIVALRGRSAAAAHAQALLPALLPALAGFALVLAVSLLAWQAWERDTNALQVQLEDGGVEVELSSDPVERSWGLVSEALWRQGRHSVELRVCWPSAGGTYPCGARVLVSGELAVPADDEGGRWNHQQGYVGLLQADACEELGVAGGLRGLVAPLRESSMERVAALGGDAAGLLGGILLGNKTLYSGTELEQDFRATGLAHLMAVSGTHLAVVTALSSWLLALTPLRRGLRSGLLAVLLALYVALTGFAPSALRACVMCAVGLGAAGFSRRRHPLSALGLCVLLFLALRPALAFSVGFELSVLCMVGLLVLAPLFGRWLAFALPARAGSLAEGLAATVGASLATLPVTVPLFCQLPLSSPLATLLATPLITAALGLGIPALLLCSALPAAGGVLLGAAGAVAGACAQLVHLLADLPLASVPLDASAGWVGGLFLLAGLALWALWPLPPARDDVRAAPESPPAAEPAGSCRCPAPALRAAVLLAFCLPVLVLMLAELGGIAGCSNAFAPLAESDAQVVMLDVGQGDAMLIRDGSAAVLVDTGEEGQVLLAALARQGTSRLNAVILSHKDIDHTGALSALAGVVRVGGVYLHNDLLGNGQAEGVLEAARWASGREALGVLPGARITVGRFTLELLAPQTADNGDNPDSLIWHLAFDADSDGTAELSGLLTGDAEEDELAGLCAQLGRVDFVKVGHHGSSGAFSTGELAVLQPRLALISVGSGNSYGHPTFSTLQLLEACGAQVLRTDLQGDIVLSFSAAGIAVRTQKG